MWKNLHETACATVLVEQCSTHTATNKSIVYGNTAVTNFACRCRHRRTSVCSAVSHRIRDSRSDSVHWHGRATVYSAASRLTSFGVHRCVCVCAIRTAVPSSLVFLPVSRQSCYRFVCATTTAHISTKTHHTRVMQNNGTAALCLHIQ